MDREATEFEDEEVLNTLEMLLTALQHVSSALPSTATRRPRTMTRIRPRRSSRLARPYPPPASAPVGLPAPGLEGLIAAMEDVDQDQPPEARRGQGQEPEVEFVMTTTPSVDHIRHGVPSSGDGTVPPTRPSTPVRRETARPRPRVVKFRSPYWVWIVLRRLPMDPLPPCYFYTSE